MATRLPTAAATPKAVKSDRIGRRLKFKIAILPKWHIVPLTWIAAGNNTSVIDGD